MSEEYEVFQVAVRWIVHGGKDRVTHAFRVFQLVRFDILLLLPQLSLLIGLYSVIL